MVRRNRYVLKNIIEVEEFLDGRYGAPGQKREKKKKATKEQMEKVNQWNKSKKIRHRLNLYFEPGTDWFVTLTYPKDDRPPDLQTVQKHFRKFYEYLGREFRKRDTELRWIRNIECTSTGNWHIHLVIKDLPETNIISLMNKAWTHGKVKNIQQLYEEGSFKDLADYLTKDEKTKKEYVSDGVLDHKITVANYSASRNMPLPPPKVDRLQRWKKEVKPPKGYYIEKETYFEGTNKFTGYNYRHYRLIKLDRRC